MNDTNSTPIDTAGQRDALRAKIEASERRIAERTVADQARDAAEAATNYSKANPLTVVGGAIAAGLLIGLITKPGRRAARNAATGTVSAVSGAATGTVKTVKSAANRGSAFGTLLGDTVVAYGIRIIDEVMDGARAGQDKLEDFGDAASTTVRKAARDAEYMTGSTVDKTRAATKRTGRRASRAVRNLTKGLGR